VRGLSAARRTQASCFDVPDSAVTTVDASFLAARAQPRDKNSLAARLASQFVKVNAATFKLLETDVRPTFNGDQVALQVVTGTRVGAVPLRSPTSGALDYGLVVRPRFDWHGLGPMMAQMGWKIVPDLLALPLLPKSERRIPPWVLSTMVLMRIRALLRQLERRFEMVDESRPAPRGSVDWTTYATKSLTRAQFTSVPCRFPDIRDDRELRSAIRFTLEKQLGSLAGQRTAGIFVLKLIVMCQELLAKVSDVTPKRPDPHQFVTWSRRSLPSVDFRPGLEAIQWTCDERGLAGSSDLQGLPWALPMDAFFEAWAETVMSDVSHRIGGVVRSGRLRQTVAPLEWTPSYRGSQKFLLPDLMLETEDTTVIVDAKYKEHWEELQRQNWRDIEVELRERHRADLLQVLAYANVARTPNVTVCLAYPCSRDTWNSLKERRRLFHRAALHAGERRIDLLLTAFPMGVEAWEVAAEMALELRSAA
jgi:hypothetical protein